MPEKSALLIVDMQKRWIYPNSLIYPSATQTISNIQKLKGHFESTHQPVFYLYISHKADGSDKRAEESVFNISGSQDSEIIDELKPKVSDILVPKTRLSGFFGTDLLSQLKSHQVTGLAIVGLELRACVMATYIDAYQNDFRPSVIISDAVLDRNESYINEFLRSFNGEDFLMTTEEWIRADQS